MFEKPIAFLKKDFLNESSYRLNFLLNIFSVLANILSYYYIDRLFGKKMATHLEEFGVGYFSYVLLSLAFFSYAGTGLGSFSQRLQAERADGTLEAILLTPTKIATFLFSMGLWNIILATFDLAVYILFGVFVFKMNFAHANLLSAALVLLLTITSFSGLGILSASFVIMFKRGNPISWVVSTLEGLVGGAYFPIGVLPSWLQILAKLLPITYGIRAIELAVWQGYSPVQLAGEIGFLVLFSLALLPSGVIAFRHAVNCAKKEGSLAHY